MSSDGNGNGVTRTRVSVLTFTFNHETCQVEVSGTPVAVALAQMIAEEGLRQLAETRREAHAMHLRQRMAEEVQNAQVAAALRKH